MHGGGGRGMKARPKGGNDANDRNVGKCGVRPRTKKGKKGWLDAKQTRENWARKNAGGDQGAREKNKKPHFGKSRQKRGSGTLGGKKIFSIAPKKGRRKKRRRGITTELKTQESWSEARRVEHVCACERGRAATPPNEDFLQRRQNLITVKESHVTSCYEKSKRQTDTRQEGKFADQRRGHFREKGTPRGGGGLATTIGGRGWEVKTEPWLKHRRGRSLVFVYEEKRGEKNRRKNQLRKTIGGPTREVMSSGGERWAERKENPKNAGGPRKCKAPRHGKKTAPRSSAVKDATSKWLTTFGRKLKRNLPVGVVTAAEGDAKEGRSNQKVYRLGEKTTDLSQKRGENNRG